MIECNSIEEAQAVPDVVHIVAGVPVVAYQKGDALPDYCVAPTEPEGPSEFEQLRAQVQALEAKVGK